MNGKIRPPSTGFTELVLYREAYSNEVRIFIGENDYTLLVEDARTWFRHLCRDEYTLERVFGYLWNMRCLKYFLETKSFIPFDVGSRSRSPWSLVT